MCISKFSYFPQYFQVFIPLQTGTHGCLGDRRYCLFVTGSHVIAQAALRFTGVSHCAQKKSGVNLVVAHWQRTLCLGFFLVALSLVVYSFTPLSRVAIKPQRFSRKAGILTSTNMASFTLLFSLFWGLSLGFGELPEGHSSLVTTYLCFYKGVTFQQVLICLTVRTLQVILSLFLCSSQQFFSKQRAFSRILLDSLSLVQFPLIFFGGGHRVQVWRLAFSSTVWILGNATQVVSLGDKNHSLPAELSSCLISIFVSLVLGFSADAINHIKPN